MPLAFTWLAYAETDSGGSILLGIFDTFEGALGMVRAPAVGNYVVTRRLLHCKATDDAVEAAQQQNTTRDRRRRCRRVSRFLRPCRRP